MINIFFSFGQLMNQPTLNLFSSVATLNLNLDKDAFTMQVVGGQVVTGTG
jgi:hydroxypyruvate isomerase